MKKYLSIFIILLSCASTKPSPPPLPPPPPPPKPEPVVVDTIHRTVIDTIRTQVYKQDTPKAKVLSVTDFGAHPGNFDNSDAFEIAFQYILQHHDSGSTLTMPPGVFFESRPWMWQWVVNGRWQFFHIRLVGAASPKSSPDAYLTTISYGSGDGFGIGVQFGRDIEIENIAIVGRYQPPAISVYNIGTVLYSAWTNASAHDSRYAPNCGIAIDPFCDSNTIAATECYKGMRSQYLPNTGKGGTSGMKILKVRVDHFPVGIALTPNGYTQNDEDIDMVDDNIFACKVNIAVCQDQSKAITIDHLKSWGPTYTVLDGLSYGAGSGGGSITCYDWNIAGVVNQFFNISTARFPLSCYDLHGESLFRIGYVGAGTGTNFYNLQIDFIEGPGIPEADWLIQGQANFIGGALRYYDNDYGHRLNFATTAFVRIGFMFRDMTICNLPILQGLYGIPTNYWYQARFENVIDYFTGWDMHQRSDTLINVGMSSLTIDRVGWTGTATINGSARVNDYLLAEPTAQTAKFYDNGGYCTTKVLGRVTAVNGNTVTLGNIAINAYSGLDYGRIYLDRMIR